MSRKRVRRTNKHHRKSRSRTQGIPYNGDINGIPNVIVVDYKRHQAFHLLFPDTDPLIIARELNNIWVDPEYMMLSIPRSIARDVIRHYHLQQPS